MNDDIVRKTNEILEEIQNSDSLDETQMAKAVSICQLISSEIKRIDEGGEVDPKAAKTFARIFDKFSAVFLEQGINPELCESMNQVANSIRKIGS
jgi:hypothetical protein